LYLPQLGYLGKKTVWKLRRFRGRNLASMIRLMPLFMAITCTAESSFDISTNCQIIAVTWKRMVYMFGLNALTMFWRETLCTHFQASRLISPCIWIMMVLGFAGSSLFWYKGFDSLLFQQTCQLPTTIFNHIRLNIK